MIFLSLPLLRGDAAESTSDQEQEDKKTEELAKETQNPVANLISVPFQNNFIRITSILASAPMTPHSGS